MAGRLRLGTFLGALLIAASAVSGENPPEVPPPKPLNLPTPSVVKLPNGLEVVVVERRALPLLTLRLVVRSGAEADPHQLPGTAQMTAEVLTQGTTKRNAREISDAVDSMAAQLASGAGWDQSYLRFTAKHLRMVDPEILADMEKGTAGLSSKFDVLDLLPQVTCPTLFLQGNPELGALLNEDDLVQALSVMSSAIRVRIERAGHDIHLQDADAARRAVMLFLESI